MDKFKDSRNNLPVGVDPREAQFYGSALTNDSCFSINSVSDDTKRQFGIFMDGVSKMPSVQNHKKQIAGGGTGQGNEKAALYNKCLSGDLEANSSNIDTCLSAISDEYADYGGILGPVPTSGGKWLTDEDGKLAYKFIDSEPGGYQIATLSSTLDAGVAVTASVNNGKFTITDAMSNPPTTATFPMSSTNRNPFYCSGHGACGDPATCVCDSGYMLSSDGTCVPAPKPKKSKYACRQHIAGGCSMAHDCLKRTCVEIKPEDPLYNHPYLVDDLGTCKLGCKFSRWAEGKGSTVNGGWQSCDDAHNYQPCYTSAVEPNYDGSACTSFWRPPMGMIGCDATGCLDGYSCTSISSPKFSYPHGVAISPVGGLPNNNEGGCHWEDEGSHGNYADDNTGIVGAAGPAEGGGAFVMCGPKWGSWQGNTEPNSVGGNQALPQVSYDGMDAQRGTLIPLSGESVINDDARMQSLCCGGSNYANESCYRSGSSCDL